MNKGKINETKRIQNLSRFRSDKTFNSYSNAAKRNLDSCMKLSGETDDGLKCFLFHSVCSDFKADISAEHSETFRLQGEKIRPEYF